MKKLGLVFISIACALSTFSFSPSDVTDRGQITLSPHNFFQLGCYDGDPAAVGTDRNAHLTWARQRSADQLAKNLSYKIALVFNCQDVQGEALAAAFADISVIIANYSPNAACFANDTAVVGRDRSAHEQWARARGRNDVRNNLQWKSSLAVGCMDPRYIFDYFADVSAVVSQAAQSGGSNGGGGGGTNATPITWSTTLEKNPCTPGQRFVVSCPAGGKQEGYLYGYSTYAVDGPICLAGVQMGLITFASGGVLSFQIVNSPASFGGDNKNGVGSSHGGPRGPCAYTFN